MSWASGYFSRAGYIKNKRTRRTEFRQHRSRYGGNQPCAKGKTAQQRSLLRIQRLLA